MEIRSNIAVRIVRQSIFRAENQADCIANYGPAGPDESPFFGNGAIGKALSHGQDETGFRFLGIGGKL